MDDKMPVESRPLPTDEDLSDFVIRCLPKHDRWDTSETEYCVEALKELLDRWEKGERPLYTP